MKFGQIHVKNIVDAGLCTGCGICAAVCRTNALRIENNVCSMDNIDKCINCRMCERCCPSYGYNLKNLYNDFFGIYEGISLNNDIVSKATSGGAITQLLCNALEKKVVDKVVIVSKTDNVEEGICKYIVTDSTIDVKSAAGSNYVVANIEKVLDQLLNSKKKYAVVALPCQLYGITQAAQKYSRLADAIKFKIGVLCGYTYQDECIDGLASICGEDSKNIKSVIGWREDGLPGYTKLKKTNGEIVRIPFIDEHSIDVTYYSHKKCLLCKDCFADYADLVAGDIGRGWSDRKTLIITRTNIGEDIINALKDDIAIEKLSVAQLKQTPLKFMEIEKRSKVTERQTQFKEPYPKWYGDYNEEKLLPIRKATVRYLNKYQSNVREKRDFIKNNPARFLKIGKNLYGGLETRKVLKYLFLFEKVIQYVLRLKWKRLLLPQIAYSKSQAVGEGALNVAIIGLGPWGIQYLPILYNRPDYNLVAVCDVNEQTIEKITKKYKINVRTVEEIMQDNTIDTVFILTPNHTHESLILKSFENGKNVYVEKPLSNEYNTALRIYQKSRECGKLLYVAHSMKIGRGFQTMKSLIEKGDIGKIQQFSCVRTLSGMNEHLRLSWRADNELVPLLPLLQLGIHLIDACIYLFDDVKHISSSVHETCGLTDYVICLLQAGEIQGSLITNYNTENSFEFVIYGSKGKIVLDENELYVYKNGCSKRLLTGLKNDNPLFKEVDEFLKWRVFDEIPQNTPERALKTVNLFEKIRNDSKEKKAYGTK